jgi:hypothetical protein
MALLSKAFGPAGIPAMLVEGVVAELEADADQLLRTLSDGRFGLRLRCLVPPGQAGRFRLST